MSCAFCDIAAGKVAAEIVWRGAGALAFLDHKPLFPGHVLVIPDRHIETFGDLPADQIGPLFAAARFIERAVVKAMSAEGSFVAVNNRVSQSVPHLHVHVVPRRKGDGLKGFFWPRRFYRDEGTLRETANAIRAELVSAGNSA
jgi:histidine triad (HIT) family protein